MFFCELSCVALAKRYNALLIDTGPQFGAKVIQKKIFFPILEYTLIAKVKIKLAGLLLTSIETNVVKFNINL